MKREYTRYELNLIKGIDIELLQIKKPYMVSFKSLKMKRDSIVIDYALEGIMLKDYPFTKLSRLQALLIFCDEISNEYYPLEYSLSPDNIVVNHNGKIQVIERKVSLEESSKLVQNRNFEFICLCAHLILNISYDSLKDKNCEQLIDYDKWTNVYIDLSIKSCKQILEQLLTDEFDYINQSHKEWNGLRLTRARKQTN